MGKADKSCDHVGHDSGGLQALDQFKFESFYAQFRTYPESCHNNGDDVYFYVQLAGTPRY